MVNFTKIMIKNSKGWIKIVEAFIAILLVAGVLLIVINKGYLGEKDISSQVYDVEVAILREIQLNDTLRDYVLNAESPIEWNDENFPTEIKDKIGSRTPNYLDCEAKICRLEDDCELSEYPEKDVYAHAAAITTTLETTEGYQLKQLKLFCWTN
jgi:hypothetical protein